MRSLETYLSGMKGQEKRIETTKGNELDYCNITAKLRDGTLASA